MAFSRDDLKKYEEGDQKTVPDNTDPFTQPDAKDQVTDAPVTASADDKDDTAADDATPSGDAGSDTPPDDSGDGTSDANDATADSSTADGADPSGDSATTDGEGKSDPSPKKGSARERIQELVDERDSYRDYGAYAQDQIRARDQRIIELEKSQKQTTSAPAAPEEDPPLPTLEDADVAYDPDKFAKKSKDWAAKVKENADKRAAAKTTAANTSDPRKVAEAKFVERANEYAKTHPDFEATVSMLPQFAPDSSATIVLSDLGPDMLYFLGKRKSEAVRIAKLPVQEQLMEFGVIRDKIRAEKQRSNSSGKKVLPPKGQEPTQGASQTPAKPKSTSNAPPPLTPVRGGGRATVRDITDPNLSMDEFVRRDREAKIAKRDASRAARGLR